MKEYIINSETVVVMSNGDSSCKIYELNNTIDVDLSYIKLIDMSCKYFGSSLKGRIDGSKYYLGCNYKLPIIIDESRDMIAFPTSSYRSEENTFILFNQIKDYDKTDNGIVIYLKDGKYIELEESFGMFENQYLRAQKLLLKLKRRKITSLK